MQGGCWCERAVRGLCHAPTLYSSQFCKQPLILAAHWSASFILVWFRGEQHYFNKSKTRLLRFHPHPLGTRNRMLCWVCEKTIGFWKYSRAWRLRGDNSGGFWALWTPAYQPSASGITKSIKITIMNERMSIASSSWIRDVFPLSSTSKPYLTS